MVLIIGLGNPGKKFLNTRHNIGFQFLDYLHTLGDFSWWEEKKRFKSLVAKGVLFGKPVILVKPQTFMNNSGEAVLKLVKNYKVRISNIWVVHDDIDLPLGSLKIVKNRGAAGHKGVQSIIDNLKTKNFVRFRVGIKPLKKIKIDKKDFVLKNFNSQEKRILENVKENFARACELALQKNIQRAMTEFNKKRSAA